MPDVLKMAKKIADGTSVEIANVEGTREQRIGLGILWALIAITERLDVVADDLHGAHHELEAQRLALLQKRLSDALRINKEGR